MISVLLHIESTGETLGPFTSWDDVSSEIKRLMRADAGKVSIYREQFVCDFCTSPDPAWLYEAGDTLLAALASEGNAEIHLTRGSWAACAPCHDLIEREEWGELIKRSAEGWIDRNADLGIPIQVVGEMIAIAHSAFRAARTEAPPTKIPPRS